MVWWNRLPVDPLVAQNRQKYFQKEGVESERVVVGGITHGTKVRSVGEAQAGQYLLDSDALITNASNLFLSITAADCLPVFFYDPVSQSAGIAHAGWRGALRTFHLGRIVSLAVNPAAPRTPDFEPRKDFSLADVATRDWWEFEEHPVQRCRVRLDASAPAEARASFGPRARIVEDGAGAVVEVDATNAEGLLRHVLSLGERAEILSPRALRASARRELEVLWRRTR